jgi:hypothetical protein
MVYNPFDVTSTDDVIKVTPDKMAELLKSYLAGYKLRVTMFHSFPNAVFKCLTTTASTKDETGR